MGLAPFSFPFLPAVSPSKETTNGIMEWGKVQPIICATPYSIIAFMCVHTHFYLCTFLFFHKTMSKNINRGTTILIKNERRKYAISYRVEMTHHTGKGNEDPTGREFFRCAWSLICSMCKWFMWNGMFLPFPTSLFSLEEVFGKNNYFLSSKCKVELS